MPNRLLIALIAIAINACCNCDDQESKDSSLMNLGADADTIIHDTKSVLDRFDGWKSGIYYGIDISHYQGDFLKKLNSNDSLHFVICKATEGVTYVDADFRINWREIKSRGLIRGAFHFYLFADDPVKQADHFIENISDIEYSDIAPVVDVEEGGLTTSINIGKMQSDLKAFLNRVEKKLKRKPVIYCDPSFANRYLNDPFFANYELWLADYTRGRPTVPEPWKSKGYLIWQKSESYSAYSTTLDLDVFQGRLNDLIR